tara:strand:+ start:461 stop:817 length:357 start_codon:yes stop_codon:yes gene_type:complete
MTKQEKLESIRKKVIMACHPECETYEEALEKDLTVYTSHTPDSTVLLSDNKITIGRVMAAIVENCEEYYVTFCRNGMVGLGDEAGEVFWKLTKESGEEATLEDQKEEVLDKLFNLLTK